MPEADKTEQPWLLVAEPSAVFRALVTAAAEPTRFSVVLVDDVAGALQALAGHPPVAVLSARMLSDLPGTSLIAALKASPDHRTIPTALLTSAERIDSQTGFDLPDRILHKTESLAGELETFFRELEQTANARAGENLPLMQKRILLAEDSATMQALFSKFLHRAGAEIAIANNGAQAVELAQLMSYDLIITDVEMPAMNGYEAIARIRENGIETPVLVLTATIDEKREAKLRAAGCNRILPKKVSSADLIDACVGLLPSDARSSDSGHPGEPGQSNHRRPAEVSS